MKFISFRLAAGEVRSGWLEGQSVIDMNRASGGWLPVDMLTFLEHAEEYMGMIAELKLEQSGIYHLAEVELCAPLPNPGSLRDFYAFEQHVKTARGRRGLDVVPEWYEMPVFYFSNHRAILGPNEAVQKPMHTSKLDYELEIACVIGKAGMNIPAEQAEQHIFGYCILNDWSARDVQAREMKVGLGPAKGKDFATSIGPYIVTKDELEPFRTGDRHDLTMRARVNGQQLSLGNTKDIHYTFAQMIERASAGVMLHPGDLIGSGTVGTGCILELGTEKWLRHGDIVELEVTGLGVLRNQVIEKVGEHHVLSPHGEPSS